MKTFKKIMYLTLFTYAGIVHSQQGRVGINTTSPSVTLDVNAKKTDGSQAEGFKLPSLAGNSLFNASVSGQYGPAQDGTLVFVSSAADPLKRTGQAEYVDTRGIYYFDAFRGANGKWIRMVSEAVISPSVSSLDCAGAVHSGVLYENIVSTGVTSSVNYTNGNGVLYNSQDIASTGVTGLTAHLNGGSLNNGSGSLSYTISGTPNSSGTATFSISFGNSSCIFQRQVIPAAGISSINCSGAVASGVLTQGVAAGGVSSTISYSGGNGGYYPGEVVSSTGVAGLSATLSPGLLANGSGTLNYTISGTAAVGGKAIFTVNIGGQTCTLTRYVDCGAYIAPGVWKNFLCHNLGANTLLDPHDMSQSTAWGLNGAYIQWGRRGLNSTGDSRDDWFNAPSNGPLGFARAPTGSTISTANSSAVSGWYTTAYQSDYSWRTATGAKTANDPCPEGYRVPTYSEWMGVVSNNTISRSGTWINGTLNYGTAIHFGQSTSIKTLTLPAAGSRNNINGAGGSNRGWLCLYWSSTEMSYPYDNSASTTSFSSNNTLMGYYDRRSALPVRCIRE